MKTLKRLMAAFAVVSLIMCDVQVTRAACANTDIECFKVGDTQKYRVSSAGNVEAAGTLAVTGATTLTGATTVSGALTASSTVSLSTTTFTGAIVPYPQTLAQINALQSGTTGQIVLCTDCTQSTICTSSGTVGIGAWVISVATGTFVGSTWSGFQHCR